MELEKRWVHIAKTFSWRFVATGTTVLIAFLITGSVAVGATIGGIEAAAKMALYYGHERAWAVGLARQRATGPAPAKLLTDGSATPVSSA